MPLATTFMLSAKVGKAAYVEPVISDHDYRFTVRVGMPTNAEAVSNGTKLARTNLICVMSGSPIVGTYIMAEGKRWWRRLWHFVLAPDKARVSTGGPAPSSRSHRGSSLTFYSSDRPAGHPWLSLFVQ